MRANSTFHHPKKMFPIKFLKLCRQPEQTCDVRGGRVGSCRCRSAPSSKQEVMSKNRPIKDKKKSVAGSHQFLSLARRRRRMQTLQFVLYVASSYRCALLVVTTRRLVEDTPLPCFKSFFLGRRCLVFSCSNISSGLVGGRFVIF